PDPLVPVRTHAPAVPESVTEVVGRALALLPSERPASARVMKVALDEAANGPVTVIVTRPQPAVPASTPAPPVGAVTFVAPAIPARDVSSPELARHDESLRRTFERYGGLVMRTTPTETGAAFASAREALRATLELQRELRPLALRMALVTGDAELIGGE